MSTSTSSDKNTSPYEQDQDIFEIIDRPDYDLFTNVTVSVDNKLPKRFPKNMKMLTILSSTFSRHIPDTVTHLFFGDEFDQDMEHVNIPKNIVFLKFGKNFNHKLNPLPVGLNVLILGHKFDQDLSGVIPNGINDIIIGKTFKREINGVLPSGLQNLVIGSHYQGKIPKYLQESIECLEFF